VNKKFTAIHLFIQQVIEWTLHFLLHFVFKIFVCFLAYAYIKPVAKTGQESEAAEIVALEQYRVRLLEIDGPVV
jgi:hypothetical protein